MNTTTVRPSGLRPTPIQPPDAWPIASTLASCGEVASLSGARPTFAPILRTGQAEGVCALMHELRRLGALRPTQRDELGKLPRRAGAAPAAQ